jgi:hypothetical protein
VVKKSALGGNIDPGPYAFLYVAIRCHKHPTEVHDSGEPYMLSAIYMLQNFIDVGIGSTNSTAIFLSHSGKYSPSFFCDSRLPLRIVT